MRQREDFRGEGVDQGIPRHLHLERAFPVARWHGDNFLVDEITLTGQIDEARLFGLEGRAGHASFRLLHVLEFRDGKISRKNVWADTAAILAQTKEKERRRV
jgi:ketosteroid isomerase-like protein